MIEVNVDAGVTSSEFLRTSDAPETEHGPFLTSEWQQDGFQATQPKPHSACFAAHSTGAGTRRNQSPHQRPHTDNANWRTIGHDTEVLVGITTRSRNH